MEEAKVKSNYRERLEIFREFFNDSWQRRLARYSVELLARVSDGNRFSFSEKKHLRSPHFRKVALPDDDSHESGAINFHSLDHFAAAVFLYFFIACGSFCTASWETLDEEKNNFHHAFEFIFVSLKILVVLEVKKTWKKNSSEIILLVPVKEAKWKYTNWIQMWCGRKQGLGDDGENFGMFRGEGALKVS
jgi:hypothetical protein